MFTWTAAMPGVEGCWTRVHDALVALAAVAFTALLWDWNLLWYRL